MRQGFEVLIKYDGSSRLKGYHGLSKYLLITLKGTLRTQISQNNSPIDIFISLNTSILLATLIKKRHLSIIITNDVLHNKISGRGGMSLGFRDSPKNQTCQFVVR